MSYGIRNSIILFFILILLVGAGWGYLNFILGKDIEKLQSSIAPLEKELQSIEESTENLEQLKSRLQKDKLRLTHYPKSLFPAPDHSLIYGFINDVNGGSAQLNADLVTIDKMQLTNYGMVQSSISGSSPFFNLYRFITTLEHSKPLNKITKLSVTGIPNVERLGDVELRMTLDSYYYLNETTHQIQPHLTVSEQNVNLRKNPSTDGRIIRYLRKGDRVRKMSEKPNWMEVSTDGTTGWVSRVYLRPIENLNALELRRPKLDINYNPFRPLIHDIPANKEDLVDVEQSTLIGLSQGKVFLKDQNGEFTTLKPGDEVYLGELRSINQQDKSATFMLNKGGVVERVILTIQMEAADKQ